LHDGPPWGTGFGQVVAQRACFSYIGFVLSEVSANEILHGFADLLLKLSPISSDAHKPSRGGYDVDGGGKRLCAGPVAE
jgi:hypothetical protein